MRAWRRPRSTHTSRRPGSGPPIAAPIHGRPARLAAESPVARVSAHRTLAKAGLLVSGAFLVSRVLGWLRYVVMVEFFGASGDLDAFLAAFRLPDLMFQLVAAGALSSAIIPIAAALLATGDEARTWRGVSTIPKPILLAPLALPPIVYIAAPSDVPVTTPGLLG